MMSENMLTWPVVEGRKMERRIREKATAMVVFIGHWGKSKAKWRCCKRTEIWKATYFERFRTSGVYAASRNRTSQRLNGASFEIAQKLLCLVKADYTLKYSFQITNNNETVCFAVLPCPFLTLEGSLSVHSYAELSFNSRNMPTSACKASRKCELVVGHV